MPCRPASQAKLVTLTTDADFDTPPVLKAYAERFGADPQRWMFLTGTKQEIAKLAIDSLKLTAIAKKPEERESPAGPVRPQHHLCHRRQAGPVARGVRDHRGGH